MKHIKIILLVTLVWLNFGITVARGSNFAERPDVQQFIQYMVKKHHFSALALNQLFAQVKLRPQVLHHFKKPLEKESWHTYQRLFVNRYRIEHGVAFWNKYANTLQRAEKLYGVPASIIVATIGVETKYGQRMGDYRVIDSLSNIAFSDSPRAGFFRSELEAFLLLVKTQKLNPLEVKGSYAGAIGQPQFMPSSYRAYAVDFSGQGKIDLMNNVVDVIGSVGNYYHKKGWKISFPIAAEATATGHHYLTLLNQNKKIALPIKAWAKYGVLPKYKLPSDNNSAKLIELNSHGDKEYWLGFHNFDVIKRYNSSDLYAMAVYELSSYITAAKERGAHG